ncbi:MAG TPA: hypothetical protein VM802_08145 [Chitinophaga sp.]|uniref:hypothetical protein n=1 Tax=Chitinophaga sp. TaxID=1869181 RepID=UPI002BD97889|nr:hypothetical protein [Chitinophaga sp.]HVI44826.1 hypothetical protein [Chitinophaga sp.]
MRELLIHLNKQLGVTVFLSSHLLAEIERTVTHLGILHKGQLRFQGSLDTLHSIRKPVMQLHTSNNMAAASLLSTAFTVAAQTEAHLKINCTTPDQGAAAVRQLVMNNIDVYQASIIKEDLEELFLKVTA